VALGSLSELGADARDALVPDDLIKPEASLLGLGALVVDSLFAGADAGVSVSICCEGSHSFLQLRCDTFWMAFSPWASMLSFQRRMTRVTSYA
jgi:hypothetical protein